MRGINDKWLFTPGPLTTSSTVKEAQLCDYGSRDAVFIDTVKKIRQRLLTVANVPDDSQYTAILMQGSGTFAIESVISSTLRDDDTLLIVINGAYGRRMAQMAEILKINYQTLTYPENQTPDIGELDQYLAQHPEVTMVAVVHCETTTGILNPLEEIAAVVSKHRRQLFVDAMSSFGAVPINVQRPGITYLVSSANKCIESVPGFAFAIASIESLKKTQGCARSLSLDLYAQWQGLEKNGQFRFTPPVQSMMAFHQALVELEAEGGVVGRGERYRNNNKTLRDGMVNLGFQPYLDAENQSYIITTFLYPDHPDFDFDIFYQKLSDRNFVIYPGKLTKADCFRLGNIGHLNSSHMQALLEAVEIVLSEMEIAL